MLDVVHYVGNGWELLGFAALSVARRRRAAFTLLPAVHPGAWGDSSLDVSLYNQADAVFCLSDYERAHLTGLGVEPARLCVTGLAPASDARGDGERFRSRHGLGDRPLILFIARKQRYKGYHALCEAMSDVIKAVPEACLITIGPDGEPPYPPVPSPAILDLGETGEAEKADALAACDVFCMPSTAESFGLVYVEAWSYGKPVVAGPAPAVRELVTEGCSGFCVRQQPDEIAAVLIRLLSHPDFGRRIGAQGRCLQQARFTWDAVGEVHRQVFAEVIKPQLPASRDAKEDGRSK
jgi:glycosyltransferase involved in cell wall biosynthesis